MSNLEKMTKAQVESALNNVNYNEAIQNYKNQRDNFEKEFSKAARINNEDLGIKFINDFVEEFNSGYYQGQAFNLVNSLTEQLGAKIASKLSGNDNALNELKSLEENNYSKMNAASQKKVNEVINMLINEKELRILIQNFLYSQKLNKEFNTSDLLSSSLSYIRQNLLSKAKDTKMSFNKTIMAGYFEEALVHKSFMTLAKKMHMKTFSLHTGSKKIKKGSHSVDPIFDEYLSFFSKDLNESFVESMQVNNTLNSGYGIQVKLWNAPWNIKNPRKFYHISSNASLYSAWAEKRSWIDGIYFLQNKVREAMGDNVAYVLGNNFIWTHEMIEQFIAQKYYLAFHYDSSNNKFIPAINWEQIDMSKP